MAKPMLVTLPMLLLLLDYWPLRRFPFSRRLLIEKLPLFLLAVLSAAVTMWIQGEAVRLNSEFPLWLRIDNALVSCATYLVQLFYPLGLAAYYPYSLASLSPGVVAGAALLLACISAAAVACRRQCPYFLVGWLWYLGMLAPVIGFVQVGGQARADRYTYLPHIGLYIALVWGAADLCRWWPSRSRLGSVTSAIVLALLMGCAWRQTCFWHDSELLWRPRWRVRCPTPWPTIISGSCWRITARTMRPSTTIGRRRKSSPLRRGPLRQHRRRIDRGRSVC